jgi:predicted ester cyclase
MKRLAILVTLALLSCGTDETPPAPTAPDWQARIREANDVLLNRGEVDKVFDFFAPTYVGHATAGDMSDPSAIAGFVTALRSAFPDLRVEVEVLVTQGDRVTWLRTHHGTQQGDFMGIPASGRSITWQEMVVTRYEGDLIAEEWGVSDMVERMQAQ